MATLITLVTFIGINYFFNSYIISGLKSNKIYYRLNPDYPARIGYRLGYLNNFFQTSIFKTLTPAPPAYSCENMKSLLKPYISQQSHNDRSNEEINVVVLMIEAFTDLQDSGLSIIPEPQPAFRSIRNKKSFGYVVSPVFGGKSINAEFELLTGFSMKFVPVGTLPYRELIDNDIFSINRVLNDFTRTAIHVVKTTNFGYSKIYGYLGFDKVTSLESSAYELDPTRRYVSSLGIAQEIIEVSAKSLKSFIFSFPNSSHAPWDVRDYKDFKFDVYGDDGKKIIENELLGYIGAMNHADKLIERLINEYKHSNKKTIIVALGDHQPALQKYNDMLANNYKVNIKFKDLSFEKLKYLVPIGVWSNFTIEKEHKVVELISMNFIQGYIYQLLQIKPTNIGDFMSSLYKNLRVFSPYYSDFGNSDKVKSELISNYEMLQYDQITGSQYSKKFLDNKNYSCLSDSGVFEENEQ